jgi:hypothetical protein
MTPVFGVTRSLRWGALGLPLVLVVSAAKLVLSMRIVQPDRASGPRPDVVALASSACF